MFQHLLRPATRPPPPPSGVAARLHQSIFHLEYPAAGGASRRPHCTVLLRTARLAAPPFHCLRITLRPPRRARLAEDNFDKRAERDTRMQYVRCRSAEVSLKHIHMVGALVVREEEAAEEAEEGEAPTPAAARRVRQRAELHLHPLQSVQLLRPDMSYLDTPETKAGPGTATLVTSHFKRSDDGKAHPGRRSTFAQHKAAEEEEPFVKLVHVRAARRQLRAAGSGIPYACALHVLAWCRRGTRTLTRWPSCQAS